jgi:hypothetical protein
VLEQNAFCVVGFVGFEAEEDLRSWRGRCGGGAVHGGRDGVEVPAYVVKAAPHSGAVSLPQR